MNRKLKRSFTGLQSAVLLVLAFAAIIAGSYLIRSGDVQAAGAPSDVTSITLGDEDAPVVMTEYSDFQCPYCGRFARDTAPELIRDYVDKGVLRIEWRDFPYFGDESVLAAQAGRAAAAQGEFWAFHDLMYERQAPMNSGAITVESLTQFARELGLDTEAFREALENETFLDTVMASFAEGQERGVRGTPSFFINGQAVVGAQPTTVFREIIEAARQP
jgi:protein-disulfide isomerase